MPFIPALKATFANCSFLTAAAAQAMRFFGTGALQAGMLFYMKYCLKVEEGMATAIFGSAFLVAILMLYPWRQLVANLVMILGVILFGFGTSLVTAMIAAVVIGIGLSGLVLIGDVITAKVVDEDEVEMGQQAPACTSA